MKFAVVKQVNGNFEVASEWTDNKIGAIVSYHQLCAALWNENIAVDAVVKIVDKNFDEVDGYGEEIVHDAKA